MIVMTLRLRSSPIRVTDRDRVDRDASLEDEETIVSAPPVDRPESAEGHRPASELDATAPHEAAPDDIAPDDIAPDEPAGLDAAAPDEAAPDEPAGLDAAAPDEAAPDEPAGLDGAAPDEAAPDEAAPDEAAPDDAAGPDAVELDAAEPDDGAAVALGPETGGSDPGHRAAELPEEAAEPVDRHATFEACFEADYARLVVQLRAIVPDIGRAHDAAQDAYARAWRRWATVGRSVDPAGWVRGVAVRSTVRNRRVAANRIRFGDLRPPEQHGPVDTRTATVLVALDRMPVAERRALALTYVAGMSIEEIAAIERTSPATVDAALLSARRSIVDLLDDGRPALFETVPTGLTVWSGDDSFRSVEGELRRLGDVLPAVVVVPAVASTMRRADALHRVGLAGLAALVLAGVVAVVPVLVPTTVTTGGSAAPVRAGDPQALTGTGRGESPAPASPSVSPSAATSDPPVGGVVVASVEPGRVPPAAGGDTDPDRGGAGPEDRDGADSGSGERERGASPGDEKGGDRARESARPDAEADRQADARAAEARRQADQRAADARAAEAQRPTAQPDADAEEQAQQKAAQQKAAQQKAAQQKAAQQKAAQQKAAQQKAAQQKAAQQKAAQQKAAQQKAAQQPDAGQDADRQQADEARRKADADARQQAAAARRQSDEARRQADDAERQAEDARRRADGSGGTGQR